jgi:hypothetical protein
VRLHEHNAKADRYPLAILVWGSGANDSIEYRKRCEIREALTNAGHSAVFSEDLIDKSRAVDDALDEELLQVDAADLVVVLYGSRGTQSEIDVLLDDPRFAEKAIIFIHVDTKPGAFHGVSGARWEKLARRAQVIEYTTEQLNRCDVVGQATQLATKIRRAAYVRDLKQRRREL